MLKQPELFWGLVVSMWAGNLMLLVINLPLIGIWVRLLRIPYQYLFPAIVLFSCVGVYSFSNQPFDVYLTLIICIFGYFFKKTGCEPAPVLLGFILGPGLEENFRRSLILSRGDVATFFTQPISLGFLTCSLLLLLLLILPSLRRMREETFAE